MASSLHVDKEDFELNPFNKAGGLGKMWPLFGPRMEVLTGELK